MAFPDDRLPIRVRMAFGEDVTSDPAQWTWSDVSADLTAQTVALQRGTANEGSEVQPSSATFELDNPAGDYTPDHPLGAHYPDVVLAVPCQISVQAGTPALWLPGATGDRATTPNNAALNITGDLDLRLEMSLDPWFVADASGVIDLIGRWDSVTPLLSYRLIINTAAGLSLSWSSDGAVSGFHFVDGVTPLPVPPSGRLAVRAVLDVNDGAGGHQVTFYTGDSLAGPWTQLGDTVTGTGTTAVANVAVPLEVGDLTGTTSAAFHPPRGEIHAVQVLNGISGPAVADPDFTAQPTGTTSFADAAGRTWTLAGGAEITDWRPRITGTVDDWAPSWPYGDLSNDDGYDGEARTAITVSGILRRMSQGAKALQSTLRRRIPRFSPVAYWPFEDGTDATQAASAVDGVPALTATGLSYAADTSLAGSDALPTWDADAHAAATIPTGTAGAWQVEFVYQLDTMPASLETLLTLTTSGGAATITVQVQTNNVRVRAVNAAGTQIMLINSTAPDFTGAWSRFQLWAEQDGANTDVHLAWITIGGLGLAVDDTYTGAPGRITTIAADGVDGNLRLGHLAVFDSVVESNVYNGADSGYNGETAGARIARLCAEEAVALSMLGTPGDTPQMGPQRPDTFVALLTACAQMDMGVLGEQLTRPGLTYRTRTSLYTQPVALVLDASADEITNPFAPILDDQRIRNDLEASRTGGSSAPATDTASITRTGRYDAQYSVNAYSDDQLPGIVQWLLHKGTWPGMRYPSVTTELAIAPQLIDDWLHTHIGDRLQVVNLPPQHPPGTVELLADGYAERLSPTRWTVTVNGSPAGPWNVAVTGDELYALAGTDGSELAAGIDADDTVLSVDVTAGPLWATDPADLPVDIVVGGEAMTLTSASGTSSPQTFNVVRAVNGISKSHAAGTAVRLLHTAYTAL